jgi:hypothetical protein
MLGKDSIAQGRVDAIGLECPVVLQVDRLGVTCADVAAVDIGFLISI